MRLIARFAKRKLKHGVQLTCRFPELVCDGARTQTQTSGPWPSALLLRVIQLEGESRISSWDVASPKHLDSVVAVVEESKVISILNRNGDKYNFLLTDVK